MNGLRQHWLNDQTKFKKLILELYKAQGPLQMSSEYCSLNFTLLSMVPLFTTRAEFSAGTAECVTFWSALLASAPALRERSAAECLECGRCHDRRGVLL